MASFGHLVQRNDGPWTRRSSVRNSFPQRIAQWSITTSGKLQLTPIDRRKAAAVLDYLTGVCRSLATEEQHLHALLKRRGSPV
jgi:hypothetical protein